MPPASVPDAYPPIPLVTNHSRDSAVSRSLKSSAPNWTTPFMSISPQQLRDSATRRSVQSISPPTQSIQSDDSRRCPHHYRHENIRKTKSNPSNVDHFERLPFPQRPAVAHPYHARKSESAAAISLPQLATNRTRSP